MILLIGCVEITFQTIKNAEEEASKKKEEEEKKEDELPDFLKEQEAFLKGLKL